MDGFFGPIVCSVCGVVDSRCQKCVECGFHVCPKHRVSHWDEVVCEECKDLHVENMKGD